MTYKKSPWEEERKKGEESLASFLLHGEAEELLEKGYKPSVFGELSNPGAAKASIIHGKHGQCGMIVLWGDDHVSVLIGTDSPVRAEAEKGSSYTTSRPAGESAYRMARGHYTDMGFNVTEVPE